MSTNEGQAPLARLREQPLVPLPVTGPAYAEFTVHAATPDPGAAIARARPWATGLPVR